jgi:hypothetical protein
MLFCPHPQPLSHLVGEGARAVLPSSLTPLPRSAPTLWSAEALASASSGSFASALHIPLACVREGACCFALTPSPSPTRWERGGVLFCPHLQPLSYACAPRGVGARHAVSFSVERKLRFRTPYPPRLRAGEGDIAGKGTAVRYRISGAGAIFPCAVAARRVLFCPHPQPLSHLVGEGCRGAARRPLSVRRKLRFRTPYPPRLRAGGRVLFCPHPQPLSYAVRRPYGVLKR